MAKKDNQSSSAITRSDLESAKGGELTVLPTGFIGVDKYQKPEGAEVITMSPMLEPKKFPTGAVYRGVLKKVFVTNPPGGKKGEGIELVPVGADMGIAIAATANIKHALQIVTADNGVPTSPYVGRTIDLQLGNPPRLPSKKGSDSWNFVVAIHRQ